MKLNSRESAALVSCPDPLALAPQTRLSAV